jgi:hypothetical protein
MINQEIKDLFDEFTKASLRYQVGLCTKSELVAKRWAYMNAYNRALPDGVTHPNKFKKMKEDIKNGGSENE